MGLEFIELLQDASRVEVHAYTLTEDFFKFLSTDVVLQSWTLKGVIFSLLQSCQNSFGRHAQCS